MFSSSSLFGSAGSAPDIDATQAGMRVESKTRRDEDEKTAKFIKAELAVLKEAVVKEKLVREDENKLIVQRLEVLEHEEIKAGERAQLKIFEQLRELRRVLQLEKEARPPQPPPHHPPFRTSRALQRCDGAQRAKFTRLKRKM